MKYMNVVWSKQNSSVFQVDSASFKDSLFYYSCPRYFVYITYSVGSRPGGLLCEPVVVHLSVCLMRAISTAISADQSLRQTDAGWTVIRCCLTLAQCETCVLSVGLSAGLEWAPTMHGSTGVRVVQSCVWGLVQTCTSIFFFLCPFFVLQNLFPPHKHKTKLKHVVKSKNQTNRQRCHFNPKSSWPMRSSK